MSSRRQARAGTPSPTSNAIPLEFRVGPLMEVWSKVEDYDLEDVFPLWFLDHASASRRFKAARLRWTESAGIPPIRRDSAAWSYAAEMARPYDPKEHPAVRARALESAGWPDRKLARAGVTPDDFPRLRAAAEKWLR